MVLDVSLGATDRSVETSNRNGVQTRTVFLRGLFSSTPNQLWPLLTTQAQLARWFGEVSGELALNERFSIKNNATGSISKCTPFQHFEVTWEFGRSVSWVGVDLNAQHDKTLLTLSHEMPIDPVTEEHWNTYGPGATGVGWDCAFIGLSSMLSSENEYDIEAGQAWFETVEGKVALRSWATAWGVAHIASGEIEKIALTMAKRTAAFYTGEE